MSEMRKQPDDVSIPTSAMPEAPKIEAEAIHQLPMPDGANRRRPRPRSRLAREFPMVRMYLDRHRRSRYQLRDRGFTFELGTEYGGEEFVRRYEAALRSLNCGGAKDRTEPRTVGAAVTAYYGSPEYKLLGPTTKRTRRRALERVRAKHGEKRLDRMKRREAKAIRDGKADTPTAANELLYLFRVLMEVAIDLGWRIDNPAAGIKMLPAPTDGFHTWTEEEIDRYVAAHPPGTTAHVAMMLMLFTAAAKADAVGLGWANVRNGRLSYRRTKRRRFDGPLVDIPIHPDLQAVLDGLPRDAATFLQTETGKQRSANGLGNKMREWCDEAKLPECTAHGLRKAIATRLAQAGATTHEIAAILGHLSLRLVEIYTRDANRAKLADNGFEKLRSVRRN